MYIDLYGVVSRAEVQAVAEAIPRAAEKLGPWFDVVTDISSCRLATRQTAEDIAHIQNALADRGMRYAVHVVGESVWLLFMLSHLGAQMARAAETAGSTVEADAILDELQAGRRARLPASLPAGCPRCGFPREVTPAT
jgi:hypothetical protein